MQPVITFTILLWGLALIGAQPSQPMEQLAVHSEMNNSVTGESSKQPNRKDVPALIETATAPWPSTDQQRNNDTDEYDAAERRPIGFEQRLSATILKVLAILG